MDWCVYTVLTGGYESLSAQPAFSGTKIPCICFTDDPSLTSDVWDIRLIEPVFPNDLGRSQREIKINPHQYLPEFDASVYIDNSVQLKVLPEALIERLAADGLPAFCAHSYRAALLDEFLEVAKAGMEESSRLFEQCNHYLEQFPDVLSTRPIWGGLLLRSHRCPQTQQFAKIWTAHTYRYSRRDQLSLPVALAISGLAAHIHQLDNYDDWSHEWPAGVSRREGFRTNQTAGLLDTNAVVRARRLAIQVDEQTALIESLKSHCDGLTQLLEAQEKTLSWRITKPLRWFRSLRKPSA